MSETTGTTWTDWTPETVLDVVAQMRIGPIPRHQQDHEMLAGFANRIAMAWGREKRLLAEEAQSERDWANYYFEVLRKVGNAWKLRAAVERIELLLGAGGDLDREELAKECHAALAEPARNCDVFRTSGDARDEFLFKGGCNGNCVDCGYRDGKWRCEAEWLFDKFAQGGRQEGAEG